MRHTEVFRAFARLKSLSSRLNPVYHLDARSVAYSVRQFEKNPPVDNYLNSICDSLQYIFEGYISFRISRQPPSEFRLREKATPRSKRSTHCIFIVLYFLEARKLLNFEPSLWPKLEATHLLYVFEQRFRKLEKNFLLEMLIPRTVFCVVHGSIRICK